MVSPAVIITGASRGIGAATATLAAVRGYAVCVNFLRDETAAHAVVEAIRGAGGTAVAVRADVSRESDVVRLFAESDRQLGPLSALVNNAGIVDRQSRVEDLTAARITRMFATNVLSAFLCAGEAVRRLSTRHGGAGGAIVNVSSIASKLGSANEYVDYAASKAAIDALTVGLAQEVAQEGIRVNGVRPDPVHTEIHASGGEPNRVARLAPTIPMRRGGESAEVARAILWLLSDEASYSTGAFIDVSGGR